MPRSIIPELLERLESESGDGFTQRVLDTIHAELNFHPAVLQALRWFVDDGHLREGLPTSVYKDFSSMALRTAFRAPQSPETTYALRALLPAKDCAVRAVIDSE